MPQTKPNRVEENKLKKLGYQYVAGADEAGRGAWAGPLVAAAVILPPHFMVQGVNDSKKITPKKREKLYKDIIAKAFDYNICVIPNKVIDKQGVGKANITALVKAITGLKTKVNYALIDGLKLSIPKIKSKSIISGDSKVLSIAAASIVAKVTRDKIMIKLDKKYRNYGFAGHKGYGTRQHYNNIINNGICPIHRRSYKPIKARLK